MLELEQRLLAREAAAVAGERAVLPDHAVARDDDRHRRLPDAGADRTDDVGPAGAARELRVADRRAVRDLEQLRPRRPAAAPCPRDRAGRRTSAARLRSTPRAARRRARGRRDPAATRPAGARGRERRSRTRRAARRRWSAARAGSGTRPTWWFRLGSSSRSSCSRNTRSSRLTFSTGETTCETTAV